MVVLTAANEYFVCSILISQLWSIALSRFLFKEDGLDYDLDVSMFLRACRPPFIYRMALIRETYEFDGHLLVVQQVCSLEKNPKGTLSNLLAYSIMDTDDIGG